MSNESISLNTYIIKMFLKTIPSTSSLVEISVLQFVLTFFVFLYKINRLYVYVQLHNSTIFLGGGGRLFDLNLNLYNIKILASDWQ